MLGEFHLYAVDKGFFFGIGQLGKSFVRLGAPGSRNVLQTGAVSTVAAPTVSPAYIAVGCVIGRELAALQFSGGVLAWGVLVPLLMYFLGPRLQEFLPPASDVEGWAGPANAVWRYIVRPIAVGGMLVGGMLVPLLMYFLGPRLQEFLPPASDVEGWAGPANAVWRYIVPPIAVGGM